MGSKAPKSVDNCNDTNTISPYIYLDVANNYHVPRVRDVCLLRD